MTAGGIAELAGCGKGRKHRRAPVWPTPSSGFVMSRVPSTSLTCARRPSVARAAIGERLPEALVLSRPQLSDLLLEGTIDRLCPLGRGALLETVDALLEVGGSPTAAAARLFCHRNTVGHRLRRIVQLIGHDPLTRPGARVWSLALLAADQRPPGSRAGRVAAGSPSVRLGRTRGRWARAEDRLCSPPVAP